MRSRSLAVASVAVLVLAAGCSDDDDPAEPTPSRSTTDGSTSAPTGSPTTGDTTTAPTPTVEPASGPVLDLAHVSVHAPRGWETEPSPYVGQQIAQHPETLSAIVLTDDEYLGSEPVDLARRAKNAQKSAGGKILPPTTLAGSPAYHLAGKDSRITIFDEWGTVHHGRSITLAIQFRVDFPRRERSKVIESVLASVVYK